MRDPLAIYTGLGGRPYCTWDLYYAYQSFMIATEASYPFEVRLQLWQILYDMVPY